MSTQANPEYVDEELSEQAVYDYLAAHPDFFERNAKLLGLLELPHATGSAVSLVERQVSVLRQKDLKRKRELKDLIEVARANDVLSAKLHEFTKQLLSPPSDPIERRFAMFGLQPFVAPLLQLAQSMSEQEATQALSASKERQPQVHQFHAFAGCGRTEQQRAGRPAPARSALSARARR